MKPKNFLNIFLIKASLGMIVLGLLSLPPLSAYGQITTLQAPLPGATGEQRVIVILVNFQDNAIQPYDIATANDVVFNQTDAYYSEVSYQKTWLNGTVVGWYTLPITVGTTCPSGQIFNEAVKAADPSVNFNNYNRIIVMFPRLTGCSWGGLGTLGMSTVTTSDGTISASRAWINYNLPDLMVVEHEFGHNLGVPHANALDCGTEVVTTEAVSSTMTTCKDYEYGDFIDIMGIPSAGHMNASFKNKLGWFDPANVVTLETAQDTGTYTIEPLENFSTGVQLIRVLRGVDSRNRPYYYNIEYRQPVGLDTFLSTYNYSDLFWNYTNSTKGALVRLDCDINSSSYVAETHLLDMTPNSDTSTCRTYGCADFRDGSLGINKTFVEPTGIEITTTAMSGSSLTVNINFPQSPRVLITQPQDGAFVRGVYNLGASVISNQTISQMSFYVDGVHLGADTASPYSLAWDTANVVDGSHALTAVAQDLSGSQGVSPLVNVTVDNTPPMVSILSPGNGSTVSGQVQVTVNASDTTSGMNNVFFLVDGIVIDFDDQTAASPHIFTWDTTNVVNGAHTITTFAEDRAGNRSNNQNIVVTLVTSQPPVLTGIGSKTTYEEVGLTFTISATDPDGDTLTYSASGLPSGATFSGQTFSWTPTFTQAGTYNVTFTVSDGSLTDTETITVTVVNVLADLVTSALSTATTAVAPGKTVSISVAVKNQGGAPAGSFTVAFSLSKDQSYGGSDDIALASGSVAGLASGSTVSRTISPTVPSTTPLGNYYICAVVDKGNTVTEEDETNNSRCTSTPIQVVFPDLVVTQISGPTSAATGTVITISNTAKNQSATPAGSFYVGLYLSTDATITTADRRIGTRGISSLAAGASNSVTTIVTVPTTLAAGTYYIGAIGDYSNTVKEINETNNALTGQPVTISAGPDLVMTAVSGPTWAARGMSVSISNTIKNQGVGKATNSSSVGLYLSKDSVITTADTRVGTRAISSLASGTTSTASTTVTIPSTLTVGTYYIGAIGDYTDTVKENNESNNARAGNTIVVQ